MFVPSTALPFLLLELAGKKLTAGPKDDLMTLQKRTTRIVAAADAAAAVAAATAAAAAAAAATAAVARGVVMKAHIRP